MLNCAGQRLHAFLPKTRAPFDALRADGRCYDLEWSSASVVCSAPVSAHTLVASGLSDFPTHGPSTHLPESKVKRAAWRVQRRCRPSGAMKTSGNRFSGPPACGQWFSYARVTPRVTSEFELYE